MKKTINIAVVGLGQVGSYLLNELNIKKKDIELKTGKKINVIAISARNINKKRQFKINKKIFFKNPLWRHARWRAARRCCTMRPSGRPFDGRYA